MNEKETPLVSIIIPVFNRGLLLQEAVQSVMRQDYLQKEIIVVDDGSSEDIFSCIKSFPLRYLRIEHCGFPGKVRNIGAKEAHGDFLAFLDSDDLFLPGKLTAQVKLFHQQKHCNLIHCRERWLRKEKIISQKSLKHKRRGNVFEDALKKCIIGPSTVMMPKAAFWHYGGFREDLEIAEDYELWLRICSYEEVEYIDQEMIIKRAGDWFQLSEKYGQIEIFRIQALFDLLEKKAFPPDCQRLAIKELERKCRIFSQGALKRCKYQEAQKVLEMAKKMTALLN